MRISEADCCFFWMNRTSCSFPSRRVNSRYPIFDRRAICRCRRLERIIDPDLRNVLVLRRCLLENVVALIQTSYLGRIGGGPICCWAGVHHLWCPAKTAVLQYVFGYQ